MWLIVTDSPEATEISFPFFPFSSQIWISWSSHNKTILNFVILFAWKSGVILDTDLVSALRFVFTCEGLFFSVHQGIFTWWWIHLHIVFKVKIEIVQTNQTNIVFWQISDLTTLSLRLIMTLVNVCSLNGELTKTKLKLLTQICDVSRYVPRSVPLWPSCLDQVGYFLFFVIIFLACLLCFYFVFPASLQAHLFCVSIFVSFSLSGARTFCSLSVGFVTWVHVFTCMLALFACFLICLFISDWPCAAFPCFHAFVYFIK